MKVTILITVIGLCFTGSMRAQEKTPAAPTQTPIPHLIFFFGDSITKAGGYFRHIRAELHKQNPTNPPNMHNFGHMSETVSNLSEAYHPGRRPCIHNWVGAVVAEKPNLIVACYGINDAIYHPFNEERFAAYKDGIESLITKFHAIGCHVVLLTPPPFAAFGPPFPPGTDDATRETLLAKANEEAEIEAQKNPRKFGFRTAYPYYDRVMARYSEWILTLADRDGVSVVDIRTPMLARINETHGGDAIHPNNRGHQIMAEAFLKEWPVIVAKAAGNLKDTGSAVSIGARYTKAVKQPAKAIPFNSPPDQSSEITSFDSPRNIGDLYGARVRGFVHPPESLEYTFAIAGDDEAELYLSTDEDPKNKTLIAYTREPTKPENFRTFPTQKSKPFQLEAGKKYYIEALLKENMGTDHMTVGWAAAGVSSGALIPGEFLSAYPSGKKGTLLHEVWFDPANWPERASRDKN